VPDVFIQRLTVSAEAIDVNDHVNNLEYLKWMQDIAIQHSSAQGWPIERYLKTGTCWMVRSHFIEYIRPAFLGDAISILTWVSGMKKGSSPRKYLFWRHGDQQILATAETMWVFVDLKTGRPRPIPEDLKTAFDIVNENEDQLMKRLSLTDSQQDAG